MTRRTHVRIDMTPMVDVAFLLLIFFMSTTQFKPPESVAVALPFSQSEIHVPDTGTILLTVNSSGQIFISTERGTDIQELAPDNLLGGIVAWRSANPGAVVVVKGDRDAAFGAMADLMDALADAKTLRFNLMTDLAKKPASARRTGA
ncbi:MAG: biopolymer transporter ExbD [Krumholzibacteria bacterium]|nr:biopolymer transporter ExbD [Candidatus Krumholzibacteria bacterium]